MSELSRRLNAFGDAMSSADSALDTMALALSAALQPRLDVASALSELDAIAAGCPDATRDGVVGYLVHDRMFEGDDIDYHDWQNSCLDRVVARRRGMPISLSILTVEVGRRVGVPLVGVGLPGHFLVGDPHDREWFADPFHGRTGLDVGDCRDLLTSLGIGQWRDTFLEPTPKRLVIARMLNNLRVSCEQRGDRIRLAIVMRLRAHLDEVGDAPADARRAAAVLN